MDKGVRRRGPLQGVEHEANVEQLTELGDQRAVSGITGAHRFAEPQDEIDLRLPHVNQFQRSLLCHDVSAVVAEAKIRGRLEVRLLLKRVAVAAWE